MKRIILHIDFDSYFASCEQQFDPKFRGKPIGVTATNGRTCIIAASKEAKKLGIKSPTRVWEAQKICPSLIIVPAQFEKYLEITDIFLDICKDYSPYVELFSLDEVFIDVISTQHLFGGYKQIIIKIRERIKNEIGEYITVSVGASYNKLLAKLASGMNKPSGFMEITKENIEDVYLKTELNDFCGIGEKIKLRLNKIGIYTPLQLKSASLDVLIEEFKDVEGHFLKNLGLGIDDRNVTPYYLPTETKSVGRNYCLPKNEYDQRMILQNIYELCEEIGIKLRRLNKKSKTIGLYLGGGGNYHGRKTLSGYIDSGRDIFSLCEVLYKEWGLDSCLVCCSKNCEWSCSDRTRRMVRQISVWAGNLEDSCNVTLSLFDDVNKSSKIQNAMDNINERFGHNTIRNGFVYGSSSLKTVPNGFMADRFERQKLVRTF